MWPCIQLTFILIAASMSFGLPSASKWCVETRVYYWLIRSGSSVPALQVVCGRGWAYGHKGSCRSIVWSGTWQKGQAFLICLAPSVNELNYLSNYSIEGKKFLSCKFVWTVQGFPSLCMYEYMYQHQTKFRRYLHNFFQWYCCRVGLHTREPSGSHT